MEDYEKKIIESLKKAKMAEIRFVTSNGEECSVIPNEKLYNCNKVKHDVALALQTFFRERDRIQKAIPTPKPM